VLWDEFFQNGNWPMASAVAIAMLAALVLPIVLVQRIRARQTERQS
jgi:putrescine transport system permease protein